MPYGHYLSGTFIMCQLCAFRQFLVSFFYKFCLNGVGGLSTGGGGGARVR